MSNVIDTWNKVLDEEFLENFNDLYDEYSAKDSDEDELIIEFQYRINSDYLYVKVTGGVADTELCYMNTSAEDETDTPERIIQNLYNTLARKLKKNVYIIPAKITDSFTRDGFRVLQIVVALPL